MKLPTNLKIDFYKDAVLAPYGRTALARVGTSVIGVLSWDGPGIVTEVLVHPCFRRQGIATALWEHVSASVALRHDSERTDKGELWVTAVGGAGSEPRETVVKDSGTDAYDIKLLKMYEDGLSAWGVGRP